MKWKGHPYPYQGPDSWQTFYCNAPSNGWLGISHKWQYWYVGGHKNRCKQHQLDSDGARDFILSVRELQYRWRTTGYLSPDPLENWLNDLADLGVVPA
jgi:hypothetical protein